MSFVVVSTMHFKPNFFFVMFENPTFYFPYFAFSVSSYRGEKLRLKRVQRHQMGAYLCIASNSVPPSVSKRIRLNVNCKYMLVTTEKSVQISYFIALWSYCKRKGFLIETNSLYLKGGGSQNGMVLKMCAYDLRDLFCIQKEKESKDWSDSSIDHFWIFTL